MKISKCKVIWSIKSRIFKQKTVLTKISLNSHSTKKRSRFRHPYRFMNLDFLGHFGILVNRSFSSAPVSMTFLTFGTYVINCRHPNFQIFLEFVPWKLFVFGNFLKICDFYNFGIFPEFLMFYKICAKL